MKDRIGFSAATRGLGLLASVALGAGCGHGAASAKPAFASAPKPKSRPAPAAEPENHLLEARWAEVVVKARKHGKEVTSAVKLVGPQIRLFHQAPAPEAASDAPPAAARAAADKKAPPRSPEEIIDLAQELRKITPLDVDHIDVLDGQVAFIDTSRPEHPEIWLHDLQLSVENLTTRVHLGDGRPVLLTASGTLARSGTLSVFITADPSKRV